MITSNKNSFYMRSQLNFNLIVTPIILIKGYLSYIIFLILIKVINTFDFYIINFQDSTICAWSKFIFSSFQFYGKEL